MDWDLIIRNANITTSTGSEVGDVAIKHGKLGAIGTVSGYAQEEFDARGLTLIPGAIDTQVHFREPGLTEKEDISTGSLAALCGGVTSYLEMPNTKPMTTSVATMEEKLSLAQGRSWSNYGFFAGATPLNHSQLPHMTQMVGVPGVKVFMGSSTGDLLVDQDAALLEIFQSGDRPIAFHCEDETRVRTRMAALAPGSPVSEHPNVRDGLSAKICVERLVRLAKESGSTRRFHVLHITSKDELPALWEGKQHLNLSCEITPQHLYFSAPGCYQQLGSLAQMNPPIRSEEHTQALWQAFDKGLFSVFGSDHAPHTIEQKAQPYPSSPSGMPGVETMLSVLLTFCAQKRMDIHTLVKMLCENPAELYGIKGKGRVSVGFDADLVLLDPQETWLVDQSKLHSKWNWSTYHGERLTGKPKFVLLAGEWAMRESESVGYPKGKPLEFSNSGSHV